MDDSETRAGTKTRGGLESGAGPNAGASSSAPGLRGLDFPMADLRDGLGPRLSVSPKGARHRQPGDIGVAKAAPSVSAALQQIAAGAPVDAASVGGLPATRTAATETTA